MSLYVIFLDLYKLIIFAVLRSSLTISRRIMALCLPFHFLANQLAVFDAINL